jgi:hypothetical protein
MRALRRVPHLDTTLNRKCYMRSAARFVPECKVGAIITSPPYMSQLTYARDNRLRLWFLGREDWRSLDRKISPSEVRFFQVFGACLKLWKDILLPGGVCILVLGDRHSRLYDMSLPDVIIRLASKDIGGYSVVCKHSDPVPDARRVRRGCRGSLRETVLVLRNENRSSHVGRY